MYICNHPGTLKYLARLAADYKDGKIETNINKSNEKKIAEMEDKKVLIYQKPDFEDTPIGLLHCLPAGCNVYYHLLNLTDIARHLMKTSGTVGKMSYSGDQMTKIYLKKWGINLFSNPNHRFKMDWNESKGVCEALGLDWTNQGLPELINQYFDNTFHVKGEKMWDRKHIPAEAKRMVFARQKGNCAKCRLPHGSNFDIDHIRGLKDGAITSVSKRMEHKHTAISRYCVDHVTPRKLVETRLKGCSRWIYRCPLIVTVWHRSSTRPRMDFCITSIP